MLLHACSSSFGWTSRRWLLRSLACRRGLAAFAVSWKHSWPAGASVLNSCYLPHHCTDSKRAAFGQRIGQIKVYVMGLLQLGCCPKLMTLSHLQQHFSVGVWRSICSTEAANWGFAGGLIQRLQSHSQVHLRRASCLIHQPNLLHLLQPFAGLIN